MKTMKILLFLSGFLLFASCINEDLDPCPPDKGDVKINLYVEKFQNKSENPLASRETEFNRRLHYLCYYLYRGDSLLEYRVVDDLTLNTRPAYVFEWNGLEFGDYTLVVVGNCKAEGVLTGRGDLRTDLVLHYPGADTTDDFFTCTFPFRVDCSCTEEFDAGLQRVQGVVRSKFVNLPAGVTEIEVTVDGVYGRKTVCRDYDGEAIVVSRRYPVVPLVRAAAPDYVLGSFPTLAGNRSVYHVRLYAAGNEVPVFDRDITDALQIRRNQLVEITTTFAEDGTFTFEIALDKDWSGSIEGGGTVVD